MALSDHEVDRIADAIVKKTTDSHVCVFDEDQIRTATKFFNALSPAEWPKFQAVMDFGAHILIARKTASVTAISAVITGLCALLLWGFKSWVTKAGGP